MMAFGDDDISIILGLDDSLDRDITDAEKALTQLARDRDIKARIDSEVAVRVSDSGNDPSVIRGAKELSQQNKIIADLGRDQVNLAKQQAAIESKMSRDSLRLQNEIIAAKKKELVLQYQAEKNGISISRQRELLERDILRTTTLREASELRISREESTAANKKQQAIQSEIRSAEMIERLESKRLSNAIATEKQSVQLHYSKLAAQERLNQSILTTAKKDLQLKNEALRLEANRTRIIEKSSTKEKALVRSIFSDVSKSIKDAFPKGQSFLGKVGSVIASPITIPFNITKRSIDRIFIGASEEIGAQIARSIKSNIKKSTGIDISSSVSDFLSQIFENVSKSQITKNITNIAKKKGSDIFDASISSSKTAIDKYGVSPDAILPFMGDFADKLRSISGIDSTVNSLLKLLDAISLLVKGSGDIKSISKELNELTKPFSKILGDILKDVDLNDIASPITGKVKEYRDKQLKEVAAILAITRANEILSNTDTIRRSESGKRSLLNKPDVRDLDDNIEELIIAVGGWADKMGLAGLRFNSPDPSQNNLAAFIDPSRQKLIGIKNEFNDPSSKGSDKTTEGLKLLAQNNLEGFNRDSIEIVAQALAAIKQNPDITVKILSESGGGYTAIEASRLLELMGYSKNIETMLTGMPSTSIKTINEPENIRKFTSIDDNVISEYLPLQRTGIIDKHQGLSSFGVSSHVLEGHLNQQKVQDFIGFDVLKDLTPDQIKRTIANALNNVESKEKSGTNEEIIVSLASAKNILEASIKKSKSDDLDVSIDDLSGLLDKVQQKYIEFFEHSKGLDSFVQSIRYNRASIDRLKKSDMFGLEIQGQILKSISDIKVAKKALENQLLDTTDTIREGYLSELIKELDSIQTDIPDFENFSSKPSDDRKLAKSEERDRERIETKKFIEYLVNVSRKYMIENSVNPDKVDTEELYKIIKDIASNKQINDRVSLARNRLEQSEPIRLNTAKLQGIDDIRELSNEDLNSVLKQLQNKLKAAKQAELSGGVVLGGSGAIKGDIKKVIEAIKSDKNVVNQSQQSIERLIIELSKITRPERALLDNPIQRELFNDSFSSYEKSPEYDKPKESNRIKEAKFYIDKAYLNVSTIDKKDTKPYNPKQLDLDFSAKQDKPFSDKSDDIAQKTFQTALDIKEKVSIVANSPATRGALAIGGGVASGALEVGRQGFNYAIQSSNARHGGNDIIDPNTNVSAKQIGIKVRDDIIDTGKAVGTFLGFVGKALEGIKDITVGLAGEQVGVDVKEYRDALPQSNRDALPQSPQSDKKQLPPQKEVTIVAQDVSFIDNSDKLSLPDDNEEYTTAQYRVVESVNQNEIADPNKFSESEFDILKQHISEDQLIAIIHDFFKKASTSGYDDAMNSTLVNSPKESRDLLKKMLDDIINTKVGSKNKLIDSKARDEESNIRSNIHALKKEFSDITLSLEGSGVHDDDIESEVKHLTGNKQLALGAGAEQLDDVISTLETTLKGLSDTVNRVESNLYGDKDLGVLYQKFKKGEVKLDKFIDQLASNFTGIQALNRQIPASQKVRKQYFDVNDTRASELQGKINDQQLKAGRVRSEALASILNKAQVIKNLADNGNDAAKGFIEGLRKGINPIREAANDTAKGYIDQIKKIFEIQSPSKLMMRIGKWIIDPLHNKLKNAFNVKVDGKHFISSIKNIIAGVSDIDGDVFERTGVRFAKSIFNGFDKEAEIKSPSRKARQKAIQIGMGVESGAIQSEAGIKAAYKKIVGIILKELESIKNSSELDIDEIHLMSDAIDQIQKKFDNKISDKSLLGIKSNLLDLSNNSGIDKSRPINEFSNEPSSKTLDYSLLRILSALNVPLKGTGKSYYGEIDFNESVSQATKKLGKSIKDLTPDLIIAGKFLIDSIKNLGVDTKLSLQENNRRFKQFESYVKTSEDEFNTPRQNEFTVPESSLPKKFNDYDDDLWNDDETIAREKAFYDRRLKAKIARATTINEAGKKERADELFALTPELKDKAARNIELENSKKAALHQSRIDEALKRDRERLELQNEQTRLALNPEGSKRYTEPFDDTQVGLDTFRSRSIEQSAAREEYQLNKKIIAENKIKLKLLELSNKEKVKQYELSKSEKVASGFKDFSKDADRFKPFESTKVTSGFKDFSQNADRFKALEVTSSDESILEKVRKWAEKNPVASSDESILEKVRKWAEKNPAESLDNNQYIDELLGDSFKEFSFKNLLSRFKKYVTTPMEHKFGEVFEKFDVKSVFTKIANRLKKDYDLFGSLIDKATQEPSISKAYDKHFDTLSNASKRLKSLGLDINLTPFAKPLAVGQGLVKGGLQGINQSTGLKGALSIGSAALDTGRDTAIDFLEGLKGIEEMPKIIKDFAISPAIGILKAFKPGEIIRDLFSVLPTLIKGVLLFAITKPFLSGLEQTRQQVVLKFEEIKKASLQIASFDPISANKLETKSLSVAKDLGLAAQVYAKGQADFLAAGSLIGAESDDLIASYDNLVYGLKNQGLSDEEIEGVIRAQVQSLSKNQIYAEELLQIAERLPGTKGLFAKVIGVEVSELQDALESGNLDVVDTLEKFNAVIRERSKYAEDDAKFLPSRIENKKKEIIETQIVGRGFEEVNAGLKYINYGFTELLDMLSGALATALKGLTITMIVLIVKTVAGLKSLPPLVANILGTIGKFIAPFLKQMAVFGLAANIIFGLGSALLGLNSPYKEIDDRVNKLVETQDKLNSTVDSGSKRWKAFGDNAKNALKSILSLDVVGLGNNIAKMAQDLIKPGSSEENKGTGWLINWDQLSFNNANKNASKLRQSQLDTLSKNTTLFDKIKSGEALDDTDLGKASTTLASLKEYLEIFKQYPQALKDANPEIQKGIDEAEKFIRLLTDMTTDDFAQRVEEAKRAITLKDLDIGIFDSQVQSIESKFQLTGEIDTSQLIIGNDKETKKQIDDTIKSFGDNIDLNDVQLVKNVAISVQYEKQADTYKNLIALQEEFIHSDSFANLSASKREEKMSEYANTRIKYQDILNKKNDLELQNKQKLYDLDLRRFNLEKRKTLNESTNKFNNEVYNIESDVISGAITTFDGQEQKAIKNLDLIDAKKKQIIKDEDNAWKNYQSRNITLIDYQEQYTQLSEEATGLLNEQSSQYLELSRAAKERVKYEREVGKELERVTTELLQKTLDYKSELSTVLKDEALKSIENKLAGLDRRLSFSKKMSELLSGDIPEDESENQTKIRLAQYKEMYRLTGSRVFLEASEGKKVKNLSEDMSRLFKQQYKLEMELINNKEQSKKKELQFELESLAISKEKKRIEDKSRSQQLRIEAVDAFDEGKTELGNIKLEQADAIDANSVIESELFDKRAQLIRDQLVESDKSFSFEKTMKKLELLSTIPDKLKPDTLDKLLKDLYNLDKPKEGEEPKYKSIMKDYTSLKDKTPYDTSSIIKQLSNVTNKVGIGEQHNQINITNNQSEVNPDIGSEVIDAIRLFSSTIESAI